MSYVFLRRTIDSTVFEYIIVVTGYIIVELFLKMNSENLEQYALEKTCANCLVKKGLNNFSGRGTAYVLLGYDIMHWLKIISDMRLNEDGMSRGMLIIPGEIGTN